jgi:hypothetical protein
MLTKKSFAALVLLVGCTSNAPIGNVESMEYSTKHFMSMALPSNNGDGDGDESDDSVFMESEGSNDRKSGYEGWKNWCEPVDYDVVCKGDDDCSGLNYKAIGRSLQCVNPWWSKDEDLKICAPGYARRSERIWRYNRLRSIIGSAYFDESDHCVDDGRPVHKQHWRCQREWKRGELLTKFMWIPYKRETTGRPWKRHRLNPDLSANVQAWVRRADDYGWNVELVCDSGNRRCRKSELAIGDYTPMDGVESNPHYGQRHRWQYGLGPYGQNAALYVENWDPMAPPEILCRELESTEAYLRNARVAVRKLASGVDCDGDGKKDHWDKQPTWSIVHGAASSGKLCPPNTKGERGMMERFRDRAERDGLDPDGIVTLETLGKPIDPGRQNEIAAEIYAIVNQKLPSPKR